MQSIHHTNTHTCISSFKNWKKRKTDKKNHAYILWHVFLFILHKLHRKKKRKCVCVHYVSQWSLTCLEFYLWRSLKGYNFHNTTCTRSITRKSQNIMCNYHIKHTAEDSLCSKSLVGCHFEYLCLFWNSGTLQLNFVFV